MLTRRHLLEAGAGAIALGALEAPTVALAACTAEDFEVSLGNVGWRTLRPRRAPRRFHLMGIRWEEAENVHVEVRARPRGGRWTDWTALPHHSDHAPDALEATRGTEPCWTGPADYFQVRVRGRATGLRARFVRCEPGPPRAGAARARRSQAPAGGPPITLRPAWGGDECAPRADPDYGEVQVAFVHHTVTANDYAPEDSASIVLGICRYHRDSNKWNDLGYNFLVDKYGQIFEGRAGGIEQAVIGAQAQGYNSVSTGIACLGDFRTVANTEPGIDAVARLIAWKLSLHGVPVTGEVTVTSAGGASNRYPKGRPVVLQRISGHRDGDETSCPGDALYGQLEAIRARAAGYATPISSVSMRVDRTTLRYPGALVVTGTLRFSDGSPGGGAPIEIQHETSPAVWETLEHAQTDGAGNFRTSVSPVASRPLRALFPGDGARPPLTSAPVAITVLPRLTLAFDQRKPRAGSRVEVSGTLGPTWPPKIQLTVERAVGKRWVVEQRKRINVRRGKFRSPIRPRRAGLYRITVSAPGVSVSRRLRTLEITGGAAAEV